MRSSEMPTAALPRLRLGLALVCFAVLGSSYVVNAMDRQVFAMLLPFVMQDYGFPLEIGGLLVSVFTLGVGMAGIPTGYLLERLSRRSVLLIAISIYSAFTVLTAYAVGFADMFLYRTATGIGEGMQIAALYTAVGAYFSNNRTFVFTLLGALFGIGNFISPLVAGVLLAHTHWGVPLKVFGVLGFIFVILIAKLPKNFTEQQETSATVSTECLQYPGTLWNRDMVVAALAAVGFGLSQFAFLSMYPTFLIKVLQLPPSTVGFIMSMFGVGALAALPIGLMGDRLDQKWLVFGALSCLSLLACLAFNLAATATHHAILTFLVGLCGGTFIANMSSMMQRRVPPVHVGKASGIYVTSVFLPASFSGYFFGVLVASVGWGGAALIQLGAIPAIGATALLFMTDRRNSEKPRFAPRESSEPA